jgi:hypothetical protein
LPARSQTVEFHRCMNVHHLTYAAHALKIHAANLWQALKQLQPYCTKEPRYQKENVVVDIVRSQLAVAVPDPRLFAVDVKE